jgi:hypothetical protein
MRRHLIAATALSALLALPAAAAAQDSGSGSPNLDLVKTIGYPAKVEGKAANYGTDIEFAKLYGRQFALAGSYYNGMQIVDISKPGQAKTYGVYDCPIRQGDVQVWRAPDKSGRILASYTADATESAAIAKTGCFEEAAKLGFDTRLPDGRGRQGTFIVDVTNAKKPRTVSFIEVPQGSHNQTVHPSGKYLYNSNSELITNSQSPGIEIIDIRDPENPVKVGELPLSARPGLGTESHDITFNAKGTRAYSAALSHGVIIDTTNPAEPKIVSTFDDEAINVWHQSDPVRLRGEDGSVKDFLIVEDEFAGAAGGPVCPSGGVHVYEITGEKEKAPEKVGYWNIEEAQVTHDPAGTCTAHVFDIHESSQLMTMAFYNGGVRVIDLSGLMTGDGLNAIAAYQTDDADSWSFKAPKLSREGVSYAYGNDIERGLDVYKFDGSKRETDNPGTWVPGPALDSGPVGTSASRSATGVKLPDAGAATGSAARVNLATYRMTCLLPSMGD